MTQDEKIDRINKLKSYIKQYELFLFFVNELWYPTCKHFRLVIPKRKVTRYEKLMCFETSNCCEWKRIELENGTAEKIKNLLQDEINRLQAELDSYIGGR